MEKKDPFLQIERKIPYFFLEGRLYERARHTDELQFPTNISLQQLALGEK